MRLAEKGSIAGRIALLLVMGAMVFYCVSCSAPVVITRESSEKTRPGWIDHPPSAQNTLYFVGIGAQADTLPEGRTAAYKDAVRQIADYLGVKVDSTFEDYATELEQNVKAHVSTKSSAVLYKVEPVKTYYEKLVRTEGNFRSEKYTVYCLVRFSREEASKEMALESAQRKEEAGRAYAYYLKGLGYEKKGDYYEARKSYKAAVDILAGIDDDVQIEASPEASKALLADCRAKEARITAELSKIAFRIYSQDNGNALGVFLSNLKAAVSDSGFSIASGSGLPGYIADGRIRIFPGSYTMGNYFYYAETELSIIRYHDRKTVRVIAFKAKGYGLDRQQAELDASKEAGVRAGRRLAAALRKDLDIPGKSGQQTGRPEKEKKKIVLPYF